MATRVPARLLCLSGVARAGSASSFVSRPPLIVPPASLLSTEQRRSYHATPIRMGGFKQNRGTGDSGKSSLFNNERRWKDDITFESVGTIDELSALLGVCRSQCARAEFRLGDVIEVLTRIQCCLQDVGAHVATPPESSDRKRKLTSFDAEMVEWINGEIDRFGDQLPPIRQFILSGGGVAASCLQHARAVARRAERTMVPLVRDEQIDPKALKFVNRLSDLLFVLGRYTCMKCEEEELTYLRPAEFTDQRWARRNLHE
ncbi:hypothetical protein PMAYCL1PPCAC_13227 [Pristionchus mayeri]|uniref:Corrinoid adenosyltransferase MMAB n=1 Tax=Pristionchus mayeri TaxID=1317129 RepID=A0AAN4ZRC4_9BILA|nr:hypothetical protein PMAYCL1PPCAC_13227 [Pristionchus mayeri]